MAEMSMNKVIHGAFRRDLDRFVGALTTFESEDSARARQLAVAWANFDRQLTDHHEGEHEIAWPALEQVGVSREVLTEMDSEHDIMAEALTRTRSAMSALESRPGAGEAEAALRAMERLRDATVSHLDHEEREIEHIYLDNRDSPAMKEMGRKFSRVSPARGGQFMAWVTDGATPEQQAAVKGNVPAPVLAVMMGVFGRGYRKTVAPVWRA